MMTLLDLGLAAFVHPVMSTSLGLVTVIAATIALVYTSMTGRRRARGLLR
jgi:hypothetical protein|nr:hypothetical protein [Kofleriaceae bacterium]